jgi:tetratricopeptide (TPR) repeat protein
VIAQRARGAFLFLRRRYEEALPVLEQCLSEEPLAVVGWARAHGVLAACLNALRQHARAKQVCLDALAKLSPEDLHFPAMTLQLQIELAHAEAGLGETARATSMLDALLHQHADDDGPLTLGALHEARARLALAARDKEACDLHTREMNARYTATGMASLVACCEAFAREQRRVFAPAPRRAEGELLQALSTGFTIGPTTLERALSEMDGTFELRVEKALGVVARELGNVNAGLYLAPDGGVELTAFYGDKQPPQSLQQWAAERIRLSGHDDVTQTDFAEGLAEDPDVLVLEGARYRVFMLVAFVDEREIPMGAVTFEEPTDVRHFVPPAALQTIATWLYRINHNSSIASSLVSPSLTQE